MRIRDIKAGEILTETGEILPLGSVVNFPIDKNTFGYKYWDTVDSSELNDIDFGLEAIEKLYWQLAVKARPTFSEYIKNKLKDII